MSASPPPEPGVGRGRGGTVSAGIREAERRRRAEARAASGLRTPARRAVWVLALFIIGLVIGRQAPEAARFEVVLLIAGAAALVGLCAPRRWARVALGVSVVAGGAGWYTLRVETRPANDLSRILADTPALITVEGMVETSARVTETQRGAMAPFAWNNRRVARFTLRAERLIDAEDRARPASGRLYVRVDGPMASARETGEGDFAAGLARAGAWVRVTGIATGVRAPVNPGEIDFRPIATDRDIAGSIRCASPALVERIDAPEALLARAESAWVGWKDRMRVAARGVLDSGVGEDRSQRQSLLGALLLGDRARQYQALSAPFVRLGVSHVLAISGLHVAIFAGFVALLVRLTGDRWRIEALSVLSAIGLMVVLIPARAPVMRAWVVIGGFAIAGLAGRRYDALNTLAWTACAVLLWRPTELWNPGFQLSFLIVGALIVLTRPVRDRLFGLKRDPDHRTSLERLRYRGEDALCASLCAWLVALPLVMSHFGIVSVLAPLVSLLIIPLVGALLVIGYAAVAAAWIAPALAPTLFAPLLRTASAGLLDTIAALDGIPGATFRVPAIGWVWATVASVVVWVVLLQGFGRSRARRALTLGALALLFAWPFLARGVGSAPACLDVVAPRLAEPDVPPGDAPSDVVLRWDTIDVGDGSAHVLRSGGDAVMFDCGSNWYGIGERTIPDAARALGAWRIPTVIISHPDLDHYSGLLDAAEPLGVRRVLIGTAFADEAARRPHGPAAFVLDRLGRRHIDVRIVGAGDEIPLGRARIELLNPSTTFTWEKDNDASLVALVRIPTTNHESPDHETPPPEARLLLCADIERDAMDQVDDALDARAITHLDAMTAPHHGSARPFAYDFVAALSPTLVVQSTGPSRLNDERYGRRPLSRL